jgi:Putative adhesin
MTRKTGILLFLYVAALLAARAAFGDVERTLRAEIPDAGQAAFAVENLVGTMRVVPGSGETATIVATVHAADDALAGSVRLEKVVGEGGATTFHVQYPESERTLRYPRHGGDGDGDWSIELFSWGDGTRYQGHKYRVARNHGRLLYVDVEVRVPARIAAGRFRNLIGRIEASGFEGRMAFDVESADLKLEKLRGELTLRGTSGDIEAADIGGSWDSEFTSGDCKLRGFRGERFSFHATSGDLDASDVEASRVRIQATSGDVLLRDADIQELESHSTSGNVEIDQRSTRLATVRVEATSGDVLLRLPREASFQADTSHSSGDVQVDFHDVVSQPREEPSSFRRGTGGAQIRVRTTSGNLTIAPR